MGRTNSPSSLSHDGCPTRAVKGVPAFFSQNPRGAKERRLPSLSLNQAPLPGPTVAILLTVLREGKSYSSKTTPRALRAATSDSTSSTSQRAWVWVPRASPSEVNNENRVSLPQRYQRPPGNSLSGVSPNFSA